MERAIAAQYTDALRVIGLDAEAIGGPAHAPEAAAAPSLYRAAPSGQEVMQALAQSRKGSPRTPLAGGHVVAEVAALPKGVAARALRAMGVDREQLREAALEEALRA